MSFDPYSNLDSTLDSIERDYNLSNSSLDKSDVRTSTGLLVMDLILGGGLVGGSWYTLFGKEQSAKSTMASTIMANMLNVSTVPVVTMIDAEGSSAADYLENIMKSFGIKSDIEHLFGLRDPTTGKWAVKPRVRYYAEAIGEKVFDYIAKLQRALPDKVKVGDGYYYLYDDTKVNRKLLGDNFDPAYLKATGKLRVTCDNGDMQALIIIDSLPALLSEKQDVDDPGNAMAVSARMFSAQVPRVKGKMRGKRMTILAINQLRDKPGVVYGPSEYEPSGNTVKLLSDCRIQLTSRSIPHGKGQLEEEESIANSGGKDVYRYVHARAVKNKLSAPYIEGWNRLWISDHEGQARGFDPMWDTYQYLLTTGQISGTRNNIKLRLIATSGQLLEPKKPLKWMDLKRWVVGTSQDAASVCTMLGIKPFYIRKFCQRQLADGLGIKLFFDNKANAKSGRGGAGASEVPMGSDGDEHEEHDV
jgi:RecA/RadA recombinase